MATEAKVLPLHRSLSGTLPASPIRKRSAEEHHPVHVHENEFLETNACDFFLFHNSADKLWTMELAGHLQGVGFGNRNLRLSLTDWNSATRTNALVEMGEHLQGQRYLGFVVSRVRLGDEG